MEEFLSALIDALIPTWQTAAAFAVAFSPFIVLGAAVLIHLRRERNVAPPQQEKLLRPPGYSLLLKLDESLESILLHMLGASGLLSIAVLGAVGAAAFLGANGPLSYTVFFSAVFVAGTVPGIALIFRAWRKTLELRNAHLGLRGEQAVAEVLHEVGDAGYRAFHDLQPKGTWNVDHVVVSTRGVFLIETKARRRRPPKREQPKHVVIYDGRSLIFPCGTDAKAIAQAQRNAAWLTDFLSKKTCEVVRVEAIVVIPGWYTENKGNFPVKVMNTNYLRTYLRKQPERIDPAQVRRIVAALDEECRTLEF
jgi:hypothetical protein